MGRQAKVILPGWAHHVTQRGNRRQQVFFCDTDRQMYLNLLRDHASRTGMQILAYCLMPNHVHVVAIPERVDSLAKGFGPTHNEYARWVHIRERQTGPHHSEGCGEVVREKTDNLLAVGKRKFVATTDSQHGFTIYPNLAQYVRVSGTNQLWVADITYLRLGREFVYLAVVLDVYSRRVVGWELGRSLNTALPLAALNKAIASRQPAPGLVHHSDRGTQYASEEFENAATQQPGRDCNGNCVSGWSNNNQSTSTKPGLSRSPKSTIN